MNVAEYEHQELTRDIIGAAIKVHRTLGPGLLESAYEACLAYEFYKIDIPFQKQLSLPVRYEDQILNCGYRIDFLVQDTVIIELKSVERLLPIHDAQLLTYMRLSQKQIGLLINFNVRVLTKGIKRMVL